MANKNQDLSRFFIVDGTALAYRSHFAFIKNPLTSPSGQNVSAIYGYTMALLRIIDNESPDLIAVAFDMPEPTFRHALYADYKATREKTPDELIAQFPPIKAITEYLGIKVLEVSGWEADDVIGTLALQADQEDRQVFMVTGDKDFTQLINDRISIYPISQSTDQIQILGIEAVKEKFGVAPERVIEVMGLMGDASDNVPGVRGVGKKTAVKLIQEFGTLEGIYENLDKVTGKALKKKLEESQGKAFLSRDLVTIDGKVPLSVTPSDLAPAARNTDQLRELLLEYGFSSLLNRLLQQENPLPEKERKYHLIDQQEDYQALLKKLESVAFLVLDLETTSIQSLQADIVGISLSFEEGEAYYLPANLEKPMFGKPGGDLEIFLQDLQPILADPGVHLGGQNIKYDLQVLARAGVREITGVVFDTMVADYLLSPGDTRHNLDHLSLKHLKVTKIPTTDIIGKGKSQISMADAPVEKVAEYACEDADMTLRLKNLLEPELNRQNLMELFKELEMPLVRVLEQMEREGVRIELSRLEKMAATLGNRLEELVKSIYEMAGEEFNINSPKQLAQVLFEKLAIHTELGIKKIKKTKTGFSTNAAVLESLSAHALPRTLLEYRQLKKLQSTYVEALPRLVNPATGRIHTSFNQTVTVTGRLSSSDPNLQNIPIRTELGREIRRAFVPRDESRLLLSADYSQIELRILAHLSEDEALTQAFMRGEDIHRDTAARIFDLPLEEVNPEMRAQAKTINFGIIYGMGPHRLARETGISFSEAQRFIASYFEAFSGVKGYIERTLEEARETGFVSTLLGRRRRIEEIQATNMQIRSQAENTAINTPIQGTAADLIKKAMINIHHSMIQARLQSAMILQVHDELIFDVPRDELSQMQKLVREKMEGALTLRVPIVVDMDAGENWLDAH